MEFTTTGPAGARDGHVAIDLRCGSYESALADVGQVDAVIVDPPYSLRTHKGHNSTIHGHHGKKHDGAKRLPLRYEYWTREDVRAFCRFWVPRCRGWIVALSDSDLSPVWRDVLSRLGMYSFAPVPCVMTGMTVRLGGDGPSSWSVFANVARPKTREMVTWGTTPGAYLGTPANRSLPDETITGGKPRWLMRALIRDYSRPGDLICDPCAGGGTTLIAAAIEGRRAVGSELHRPTFERARDRIAHGYTPLLPGLAM